MTDQLRRAREMINSLQSEQAPNAISAPPAPPFRFSVLAQPEPLGRSKNPDPFEKGTSESSESTPYAMARYQSPPLCRPASDFDAHSFPLRPLHISHSSQQLRSLPGLGDSATTLEAYNHDSSPTMHKAEDQKSAKDKRIANLEAEVAELKRSRDSPTTITAPRKQEQVFRDLVTKYKNVKILYFELRSENAVLTRQVEELQNSKNAPDGKDKIIEAWKAQYEKLSTEIRAQQDTDALVSSWREKYDLLMALHSSSQEEAARSAEQAKVEIEGLALELQNMKEAMRIQGEELSRVEWSLSDAQRKLEEQERASVGQSLLLNDQKVYFEQTLEGYQRQLEVERQEKERTFSTVQRLGALWQEAHKIMGEVETDAAVSYASQSSEG